MCCSCGRLAACSSSRLPTRSASVVRTAPRRRPRPPTDLFIGYTVVSGVTRLYADFTPPANNGGERESGRA